MKKMIFAVVCFIFLGAGAAGAEEVYGLKVGDQAPDFTLEEASQQPVTLSDLYASRRVILIFYRGGWCPYCNAHLQDFQKHYQEFKDLGFRIAAVSVDTVDNAAKTVDQDVLEFPVLANPDASVLEMYKVVDTVPEELFRKYKEEYNIDLEAASGQTHHKIAVPALYVIDQTGKIFYAHADPNYKVRVSAQEMLNVLTEMQE